MGLLDQLQDRAKTRGNFLDNIRSPPPTLVGKEDVYSKNSPLNSCPVLAEVNITGTQLHKIAGGECVTLSDGILGIRFLLKSSFKSNYNNYVVNNFKLQVVALGKDNAMQKEDIAVKTKVKMVTKEKVVIKKEEKKLVEAKQATLGEKEVY